MAKENGKRCYIPKRYVFAILGHCGLLVAYSLRVNLSVGLVAMINSTYVQEHTHKDTHPECPGPVSNQTNEILKGRVFSWDEQKQGLILGAFYYGYVVTQIPGGMLATHVGGKWVFGIGILMTSVMTILTPFAADFNVDLFIAARVIEGLAEGASYPAIHALLSKWSPIYERSKLVTIIYSGSAVGTVISYPISGILCKSDFLGGWPSVFYLFGAIGVLWFVLWIFLTASSPESQRGISSNELAYICRHRGASNNNKTSTNVPWKRIFMSPPFWAILVANTCNNWSFYTFLTCLPLYFEEVLNFPIKENGFLSALPYLLSFCITISCGQAADFLRRGERLSTAVVRKIFNSIGMLVPAGLLIAVNFVGCSKASAVAILSLAVGSFGASNVGYSVNPLDIAPKYAGVLLGMTNTCGTISGIFAPMIVGFLTEDKPTRGQWQKVFLISSAVSAFGGVVFLLLASGQEQPWSHQETSPPDSENSQLINDRP